MTLSIILTADEEKLATDYANSHSLSLEEAFKNALFEKIEDEYDLAMYEEAYAEYIKNGKKTISLSDLKKELGL